MSPRSGPPQWPQPASNGRGHDEEFVHDEFDERTMLHIEENRPTALTAIIVGSKPETHHLHAATPLREMAGVSDTFVDQFNTARSAYINALHEGANTVAKQRVLAALRTAYVEALNDALFIAVRNLQITNPVTASGARGAGYDAGLTALFDSFVKKEQQLLGAEDPALAVIPRMRKDRVLTEVFGTRFDELENTPVPEVSEAVPSLPTDEPLVYAELAKFVKRTTIDQLLGRRQAYYEARVQHGLQNKDVVALRTRYQEDRKILANTIQAEVARRRKAGKNIPIDAGAVLTQFWLSDQGIENALREKELAAPKRSFIGALAHALSNTPFGRTLKLIAVGAMAGTLATDTMKDAPEPQFKIEHSMRVTPRPKAAPVTQLADAPHVREVVIANDAEPLTTAEVQELVDAPELVSPHIEENKKYDTTGLWKPGDTPSKGK